MILKKHAGLVFQDQHRYRVLVSGRRFGKTMELVAEALQALTIPNSMVWYICPSYRMAKQIAWVVLQSSIPKQWVSKKNEQDLSITLVNNSTIALRGCDSPDSLRGVALNLALFDEYDFIGADVWPKIIRPMLATTNGRAIFSGTPDGFTNLFDLYQRGQSKLPEDDDWSSYQYTTLDGGWVAQEEVDAAMRDMDDRTFRQEFKASFETSGGRVYYAFDRAHNIRELEPEIAKTCELAIGLDFNVSPCCTSVLAFVKDTAYVIDEIVIPNNANTHDTVAEVRLRYGGRVKNAYPDPSSRQRSTSAEHGVSDFSILKQSGFNVFAALSTLSVRDGINAVNSRLCSVDKHRRLFISSKCKNLIKALESHSFKRGTSQPDKDIYVHHADSLRYPISYLYPIIHREFASQ